MPNKKYYDKNKKALSIARKDYYQKNKLVENAKAKDYYYTHKEKCNEYNRKNGHKYYETKEKARLIKVQINTEFILDYLQNNPCSDCGESDVRVLSFHHLGNKTTEVSAMRIKGYRLETIKLEIAKCVVLCENCHRFNHPNKNRRLKIKERFVSNIKKKSKCTSCGYNKCTKALEFHHLREKIECIGKMVTLKEYTIKDIELEIEKCVILCSNCHRRLHNPG